VQALSESGMMGLEPTTFCMALAGVRAGSLEFAETFCLQRFRLGERTHANLSERRVQPLQPS
jgi:hypothetical protein